MGGSGGYGFRRFSPQEVRQWIEESNQEVPNPEHDSEINHVLGDLLAQYNDRDVELTRSRLEEIQDALEDVLDTTVDLRFGGSIAKHTYFDGLSDIDSLVILRDPDLAFSNAGEVLDLFAVTLHRELGYDTDIREGQLAVTVTFPDGMKIQLLPAVRTPTGIRIPSANSYEWSQVIRPQRFAEKLTQQNEACGRRLVPVIKLAKSVLADLPEEIRPTGYHIESLALEAFENYSGPNNYKSMLRHFFLRGSELVLSPIRDSTGQSLNVDENLGAPESSNRQLLSGALERTARRMANADRHGSTEDWLSAIGEAP